LEYSKNYRKINMINYIKEIMLRSQPHAKRYFGPIILDSQPMNWLKRHRSFADKAWFEGQIRYGEWIRERKKPNYYLIYAKVIERIEPITVLIKIKYCHTHVLAYHAHVIQ